MYRNLYPEESQKASLKDVMSEPPMTIQEHLSLQERRVATRRRMEDVRLRRAADGQD